MKEKFPKLIELIENLSSEIDFNMDGQMVELEHEISTYENNNSYSIELNIRRPRHMFLIQDSFNLSVKNENIEIDYCRKSQSIIPMMAIPIPDNLERKFKFDMNENEEEIFKGLMRRITEFFSEYKYVDQTYKIAGEES